MRTTLTPLSRSRVLQAPLRRGCLGFRCRDGGPAWQGTCGPDVPRAGQGHRCHAHLYHHSRPTWADDDRKLIEAADRLGIDQLCCSILTPQRPASAEGFRDCNRWVAEAMKRFPGRVLGYCYVNPGHTREALEEIRRCVEDRGFIGVKLYNEYRCTDPVVFPIVELAIELRVPILHHAGHPTTSCQEQPHISDGGQPRRAGPALSRGHADLRRHLRRRRLGVDDQGPPARADAFRSTPAAA